MTVRLKSFCQIFCQNGLDWNETLDQQSKTAWNNLLRTMKEADYQSGSLDVTSLELPVVSASLQGFCDASVHAYAAVVYRRIQTSEDVQLKFVTSKTRVAQLVKQTIPDLNCWLAWSPHVRSALQEFIQIRHVRCCTDSVHWVRGEKQEWKHFVQNRALEIRRLIKPEA